ncbi:glycosyltransferase family 4 protein [Streptomyces ovatisporus]|uniref:D-inositol 3-phosphate glycosyltransferase n=1 Tax=Streptomyces ovatisporus TaxID=1128682 RepID=A0ABV9AJD9_9ACTN
MKIVFLLDNAYGIGGTIRSTVNLSRALADRHTVEVVSLRRTVRETALQFDPRVTMTHLLELRRDARGFDGDDPRFHQPSIRFTEGADHLERGVATHLGDLRVEEFLRNTDADVVIATRPKINDYLAAYGSDRYLRIGQEHLTHAMHSDHVRTHQDAAIPQLDAFVTVSYADAANYRAAITGTGTATADGDALITCIPNAVPAVDVEPSDGDSKLIVAAGRLIKVKRYDRLINAFALVSERHPDWRLRLYGRGRQQAALRKRIDNLGLYDRAFLMGPHAPIEAEWAKGAIAAVSSDAESFGMTLVEAMHCGVPVVSTDCPYGPGEIISNGQDGLLSPLGPTEKTNVRAYADALMQLIENPELRYRMSRAALQKAARYAPERIAREYEQLIEKLQSQRRSRPVARPEQVAAARPGGDAGTSGPLPAHATAPAPLTPPAPAPKPAKNAASGTEKPVAADAGTGKATAGKSPAAKAGGAAAPRRTSRPLRRLALRTLGPVLRPALRMWRAHRNPAGPAAKLRRPLARARVATDGSLVIRLLAKRLPKTSSVLLVRSRRDSGAPHRIPLPPRTEAVDGWVEVRLERAAHPLAEDRWDTYVERVADGKRKRVQSELVETARLLTMPPPLDTDDVLAPCVPYTTLDGYLAVRAWHRPGHAEVTAVDLGPDSGTVRAELYGEAARAAKAGEGAVVAVSRTKTEPDFELPFDLVPGPPASGTSDGPARTAAAPPTAAVSVPALSFELPYELPAALDSGNTKGVWDLWFRPGPQGTPRIRFGRLLGDLADRKKTDLVPRVRLGESETGLWFYFSLANDLVLALQPLPLDEPAKVATAAPAAAGVQDAGASAPASSTASSPASSGGAPSATSAQSASSSPDASASS